MHTNCLLIAFDKSAAATVESTPPDNPRITVSSLTIDLIYLTLSAIKSLILQLASVLQTLKTKFLSNCSPSSVCVTSG